jgi:hypothetical protein
VAEYETFIETTKRLLHPVRSSTGAWTVEIFGYLMLVEGGAIVIAPHGVASLLNLPDLRLCRDLFSAGGFADLRARFALHGERQVECARVRVCIIARSAVGSVHHAGPVVLDFVSSHTRGCIWVAGFLQLPLDSLGLAQRP